MKTSIAILFLIPLLTGCLAVMPERERLEGAGKYEELVKLEEDSGLGKAANSQQIFNRCHGYAKAKRYQQLFLCADDLEKRIAGGDKGILLPTTRQSWLGGGHESDGSAYPWIFRAEAHIDLGDYNKAVGEAKAGVGSCTNVESTFGGIERQECFISSMGLLAVAAALDGDASLAEKTIGDLKAFPLGLYGIAGTSPRRSMAIAKAYVALGKYQDALGNLQDNWGGVRALANMFGTVLVGAKDLLAYMEIPLAYVRARVLMETRNVAQAKSILDELLAYPQVSQNGEIYWMLLSDRGRIAEMDGKQEEAIEYFRKATEVIERQRSTINTEASKIGFVGDKQAVYRQLVAALYASQNYPAAFEYVERAKSRALVDMLAAKQDFAVSSGNVEQVKALLAMAGSAEADALVQDASADKSQARNLAISIRQKLGEQAPELASLVNVSSLSTSEVQALLPQDEALVEYYYNASDFLAFVLTRNGIQAIRLDERGLLDEVRAFRQQVETASSAAPLEFARKFYDRLIAPVAALTDRKKLIVVAHGPLHYLPFNALHDGSQYVVEKFSLRLLPSASVLKYLRAQAVAKPGGILAFGNPDLGNPRFDLPYAQEEAVAVTQGRPQSRVLLRKEASESAFRQYGGGFRYLHFATHGVFNPEAPLKSALLLAKDAGSDGMLTVDKLYSLRLDADLVTLSACETGLGKIANGDDVVGLTRGFLYAGSRSIVASLWKVDDLATSFLMTRFYNNLKLSDKREALRQAQLDTLKKYPHPFFWAAFQITGSAN